MMKGLRLLAVLLLGAAACAAPREQPEAPEPFSEAVDVTNRLNRPVDVNYYARGGGGPHLLGTVSGGDSRRFVLPAEAGFIFAMDAAGGGRIAPSLTSVAIRRVNLQGR